MLSDDMFPRSGFYGHWINMIETGKLLWHQLQMVTLEGMHGDWEVHLDIPYILNDNALNQTHHNETTIQRINRAVYNTLVKKSLPLGNRSQKTLTIDMSDTKLCYDPIDFGAIISYKIRGLTREESLEYQVYYKSLMVKRSKI